MGSTQSTWGQIKNIKLHIVTDIKSIKAQKNESQVEEEESPKVEEEEKKDERKIEVKQHHCYEDRRTTYKQWNKRRNMAPALSGCHHPLDDTKHMLIQQATSEV